MRKDPFEINLLLDAYESLLTPKQQEVMQLHYREDFSLSRAGALDHIRRASDALYAYEKRLHLIERGASMRSLLTKLRAHCDEQGGSLIDQLEDLLS